MIFSFSIRDCPVRSLRRFVGTPARELSLLGPLLERLEQEPFISPAWLRCSARWMPTDGPPRRRSAGWNAWWNIWIRPAINSSA